MLHNSRPAKPHAPGGNPALHQYCLGLAIGVVAPMLAFALILNGGKIAGLQWLTAMGCAAAMTMGFAGFRKLHLFPGSSSGYILMSLTVAYSGLAIIMLMLRLDYSRPQLATSYGLSLVALTLFQLIVIDRRRPRLAVIPGGRSDQARLLPAVDWRFLESETDSAADVNAVVVDLRHDHSAAWSSRITDFVLAGVPVYHISDAFELLSGRVEIQHLSENTLGSLNPNAFYLRLKSLIDRLCALILLIISSPVLIALMIAIRLESPGPAVFIQTRIGQGARPFRIFKLRTMVTASTVAIADDQEKYRQSITLSNDPRITKLGRALRRYRLDELPQLLNIVLGQMSFVGPRPEAWSLVEWYEREIPFYHYRHIMKPGLTGWAQVNQGHVAEITDVRDKLYLDFYYVKYFSLWLDVLILFRTVLIVLTGFGSK